MPDVITENTVVVVLVGFTVETVSHCLCTNTTILYNAHNTMHRRISETHYSMCTYCLCLAIHSLQMSWKSSGESQHLLLMSSVKLTLKNVVPCKYKLLHTILLVSMKAYVHHCVYELACAVLQPGHVQETDGRVCGA